MELNHKELLELAKSKGFDKVIIHHTDREDEIITDDTVNASEDVFYVDEDGKPMVITKEECEEQMQLIKETFGF